MKLYGSSNMKDATMLFVFLFCGLIAGFVVGVIVGHNEPIVTYTHTIDNYRYVVMCENKNASSNPKCSYFINGKQVPDPFNFEVK